MTTFKTILASIAFISAGIFATNALATPTFAPNFYVSTNKLISWQSSNSKVWFSVNKNRKALYGSINPGLNGFTSDYSGWHKFPISTITFSDATGDACILTFSMSSVLPLNISAGNDNMTCSFTGKTVLIVHK